MISNVNPKTHVSTDVNVPITQMFTQHSFYLSSMTDTVSIYLKIFTIVIMCLSQKNNS